MINYGKHYIDQKDIKAVISTLKSDFLTQGPKVIEFEKKLNSLCGSKYACAVSSGTAALHLAILSLGIKKNDYVITTPMTFLASANSILYAGARPVFVDIHNKNYCIDLEKLEKKLIEFRRKKRKIKAVIVTDYAGHVADWNKIKRLSKKYKFFTINDNCHALGAKYKKDKKYACKFADIVTQSFHPVKVITTGEGGAVLTNYKKFFDKINILRTHGIERNEKLKKKFGNWYYQMNFLGYNYRLSDLQASLGISQLKKITKFINKRKKLAKMYDFYFKDNSLFSIPHTESYCDHSYHIYPLKINFSSLKIDKKKFFQLLFKKKLNLQVHYIPIHLQNFYKKTFNYKIGDFPASENHYKQTVSLPLFYSLKFSEQKKVVNKIFSVCEEFKK